MIQYGLLASYTNDAVGDVNRLLAQLSPRAPRHSNATLRRISDLHPIFVATDTGLPHSPIVGMATLVVIEQLVGTRGRVEDVVVDEAYRGHGIARGLMQELHARAKRDGINFLALSSRPDREAANALYVKLGYKRAETNAYVIDLAKI